MTSKDDLDRSNTLVGEGNIAQQKGELHEAISLYRQAIDAYPENTYAWHDIFAAACDLARKGEVNLELMRAALGAVKQLEAATPRIGAKQVGILEANLEYFESREA